MHIPKVFQIKDLWPQNTENASDRLHKQCSLKSVHELNSFRCYQVFVYWMFNQETPGLSNPEFMITSCYCVPGCETTGSN